MIELDGGAAAYIELDGFTVQWRFGYGQNLFRGLFFIIHVATSWRQHTWHVQGRHGLGASVAEESLGNGGFAWKIQPEGLEKQKAGLSSWRLIASWTRVEIRVEIDTISKLIKVAVASVETVVGLWCLA